MLMPKDKVGASKIVYWTQRLDTKKSDLQFSIKQIYLFTFQCILESQVIRKKKKMRAKKRRCF